MHFPAAAGEPGCFATTRFCWLAPKLRTQLSMRPLGASCEIGILASHRRHPLDYQVPDTFIKRETTVHPWAAEPGRANRPVPSPSPLAEAPHWGPSQAAAGGPGGRREPSKGIFSGRGLHRPPGFGYHRRPRRQSPEPGRSSLATIWLALPAFNEERSLPSLLEGCVPVARALAAGGGRW